MFVNYIYCVIPLIIYLLLYYIIYCSMLYNIIYYMFIYYYTITNCTLYIIAYKFQIFIKLIRSLIKIVNSKEPSRLLENTGSLLWIFTRVRNIVTYRYSYRKIINQFFIIIRENGTYELTVRYHYFLKNFTRVNVKAAPRSHEYRKVRGLNIKIQSACSIND